MLDSIGAKRAQKGETSISDRPNPSQIAFVFKGGYVKSGLFWTAVILLILGSYALGRRLAGKNAGLACAFAVATLPIFDNFSRKYFPHFHSTAFLIWAFVLVVDLQAGGWKYWRGVLLGLLLGLSWLTHPITILMSIPILTFLVFKLRLFFRKDKQEFLEQFFVPLSALLTAVIIYAPMVFQFSKYYRNKKNFIVLDTPNIPNWLWLDRTSVWCSEIVQYHLGWVFAVAGLIGLFCLCMAIIISDKKPFPLLFLTASAFFQLFLSLLIRINNGLSSDGMIVYALLPPVIAGGIYLLYHRDGFSRWLRGVIVIGTVLCLSLGVVVKGRTQSIAETYTIPYLNYTHLLIFPEFDLQRQIIKYMMENSLCRSATLTIRSVVLKDGEEPVVEQAPLGYLGYMRMFAALYGWHILPTDKNQQVKESYELFYLLMNKTAENDINKKNLRKMIKTFHQCNEITKSAWFLSTRPYNDPFVDFNKPETLAVLIKHIDLGAECPVVQPTLLTRP